MPISYLLKRRLRNGQHDSKCLRGHSLGPISHAVATKVQHYMVQMKHSLWYPGQNNLLHPFFIRWLNRKSRSRISHHHRAVTLSSLSRRLPIDFDVCWQFDDWVKSPSQVLYWWVIDVSRVCPIIKSFCQGSCQSVSSLLRHRCVEGGNVVRMVHRLSCCWENALTSIISQLI